MKRIFERRLSLPAPPEQVFAWHERDDALEKLIPPGDSVTVVERRGGLLDGGGAVLLVGVWPFRIHWVARHEGYIRGKQFRDVQDRGPFKSWAHTHTVLPDGSGGSILIDHVEYELPFGFIGSFLGNWFVKRKLDRMFEWRHAITYRENASPAAPLAWPVRPPGERCTHWRKAGRRY